MNIRKCIYNNNIMLISMLILLLSICVIIAGKSVKADESITYEKSFITYEIEEGDTLSGIAAQYATSASDYQFYIDEVKSINNLKNDTIHAGCYLVIPVYMPLKNHIFE